MVDVVGLRFVSEGEQKVIGAIQSVDRAQQALESTSRALEGAIKRGAATFEQAITAYIALERAGVTYSDVLRGIEQDQRMAAEAAQYQTNKLLNVEQGYRSARDSAAVFSAALQEQAQAASQALQWTAALNERMGVTGQRATELGATFERLADVQRNLAAGAAAWTATLNERMGVTGQRATELGATFERLAEVQRNLAAGAAAWTSQLNERLGVTGIYKDAADSAAVFSRAQDEARVAVDRLRASIDPVYASKMRMRQAADTVRQALAQQVITLDQARAMMRAYSNAAVQMGDAQVYTRRSMNDVGMGIQQVGYQVGDFLVQVQSGTNAFVAFGQQATQLVGILPMFSAQLGVSAGALIGISSVLGIAIPLVTAIAAGFMRTGAAADETAAAAQSLQERVQSLTSTLEDFERARRAVAQGITPEQLLSRENLDAANEALREVQREVQRLQEIMAPQTGVAALGGGQTAAATALAEAARSIFGADTQSQLDAAIAKLREAERIAIRLEAKLGADQRAAYEQALVPLSQQIELLRVQQRFGEDSLQARAVEHRQALANYEAEIAAQVRSREITDAQGAALISLNRRLEEGKFLLENQALLTEATNETVGLGAMLWGNITARISEAVNEHQTLVATAQERITQLEQEAALNEAIAAHGRDSAEVEALRRAQHMATVEASIQQLGLTGEIADRLREAAAAAYDTRAAASGITNELSAATTQARNLASALNAAGAAGAARQQRIAVLTAQIAAARAGADTSVAGTRAEEEFRLAQAGLPGFLVSAGGAIAAAEAQTVADLTAQLDALTQTGGGPSGGAAAQQNTLLADLRAEQEQRRALLAVSGEQRALLEEIFALESRLRELNLSREQIERLAQENLLIQQQEEYVKRVEAVAQSMENAFQDAFVQIVTGAQSAEEAISNLLSSLASMFAQAAFQSLFGGMFTGLGALATPGAIPGPKVAPKIAAANGAAFMGGNVIPFANGGVVSSPTTFPMARGNVGLMGEAGPEAIMPLRRGSDGKLGVAAQQAPVQVDVRVFVDENGNFDAKVERIADARMRRAAPQIVRQSVQATYAANSERKLK